jgi:hypothetical protein
MLVMKGAAMNPDELPIRLTQWFDKVAQLRHHFFPRDGEELLLFAGAELPPSTNVLLQIAFRDSDETCVLYGCTHAGDSGAATGTWLTFPTQEMVRSLIAAATTSRRSSHRFPTDVAAVACTGDATCPCQIVEVSYGGARLHGVQLALRPGDEFQLKLEPSSGRSAELDTVQLIWSMAGELGVRFRRPASGASESIIWLVHEARHAWEGAPVAHHPPECRCDLDPKLTWEPLPPPPTPAATGKS